MKNTKCLVSLLVLLILFSFNSCDNNPVFSVTYISNIDGVEGKVVSYKESEDNAYPDGKDVFTNIPSGKFLVGYTKIKGSSSSDFQPGDKITNKSNHTLYALWEDGTVYTLSFQQDHGGTIGVDKLYYRAEPQNKRGWYIDASCTKSISIVDVIYGKTIKFDTQSELTSPSSITITREITREETPDENSYSYYFEPSKNASGEVQKGEEKIKEGGTLNSDKQISINWGDAKATIRDKEEYPLPLSANLPTITRTDYNFVGWYKEAECKNAFTNDADYDKEDVENFILYAKWERVK